MAFKENYPVLQKLEHYGNLTLEKRQKKIINNYHLLTDEANVDFFKKAELWLQLGHLHHVSCSYSQAIVCYDKTIEIVPNNDEAFHYKGIALFFLERGDDAIACCDKALDINPDKWEAWFEKANILYSMKKYNDAIAYCDKALYINPDDLRIKIFRKKCFSMCNI